MLWLPQRQKPLIGLAVSSQNIHILQVKQARKSIVFERTESVSLPEGVFACGRIQRFTELGEALTACVQGKAWQGAQVAIGVPLSQVKIHRMLIPAVLKTQDIEAEVFAEAKRLVGNHGDMAVDYHVCNTNSVNEQLVILAAAIDDYHQRYVRCVSAAGLSPVKVDIDSLAQLRAACFLLYETLTPQVKITLISLSQDYGAIVAQQADELLFHQYWHADHHQTQMQWLAWCCQAYRQSGIRFVVLVGNSFDDECARAIIKHHWSCEFLVPYQLEDSSVDMATYLQAVGLAMRGGRW